MLRQHLLLGLAAQAAALVAPRPAALHRTPAQTRHDVSPRPHAAARRSAATRRDACLVQIDSDGSRQQIECTDGSAEYLRDRNDGAAGSLRDRAYASTRRNLRRIFLPVAVNEEYVSYTRWRCVQRLLSATVNVFGVQAMVMAVGLRDAKAVAAGGAVVGAAAAVDWVLKDALGKVTRLGWAARMGREFDGDAKRWRFRSSLLYATGNGLQIATFAFPLLFLLLATVANCLKQVSMLTSTATRSAIYRSFAATETTNNLGDVTAKGEAQIAVCARRPVVHRHASSPSDEVVARFLRRFRAGRRFNRVADRFTSLEEAGCRFHPSEPPHAAGDLREPVAAGDSGDV